MLTFSVIVAEFALAGRLIFHEVSPLPWVTAAAFFSLGAVRNAYLLMTGARSCGCLGEVALPPGVMILLDSTFVGALVWFRPRPASWIPSRATWGRGGVTVTFLLCILPAITMLGSLLRDRVAGQHLAADPGVLRFGEVAFGDEELLEVSLINSSDHPVVVMGARKNCKCLSVSGVPAKIAARSKFSVLVKSSPTKEGEMRGAITFLTNDEVSPTLVVPFSGFGANRSQ